MLFVIELLFHFTGNLHSLQALKHISVSFKLVITAVISVQCHAKFTALDGLDHGCYA